VLTKPNPEGLNRYTETVLKELDDQNAEGLNHSLNSRNPKGIIPNEHVKTYLYAASSLGRANASGRDENGEVVKRSTEDYPQITTVTYNEKVQPYLYALIGGAKRMLTGLIDPPK